jgi:hypothetical protein
MNQKLLYGVLGACQSIIYSFEDYPALLGSWRVSFFCNGYVCQITSNRKDGFMELNASKTDCEDKNFKFIWPQPLEDEFELNYVKRWLQGLF